MTKAARSPGSRRDGPPDTAVGAAMRMLARRALSEGEIFSRLVKRGFPDPEARTAVGRLRELGLADDTGLCAQLARHYLETRGYGPAKIAWTLRSRGFPPALVEDAVRACCPQDDEAEAASAALRKKFRRGVPPGREGAARAYRFLAGRGFRSDACRRALGAFAKEIQEGED